MAARLRVVFAYRPKKRGHGARIMRVEQLSAMARAHLGDVYEFETRELFRPGQKRRQRQALQALRGGVVIFLKGSGYCFDAEGLARLKAETRAICIDHLDGYFGAGPVFPLADLHIVASHAARRALSGAGVEVAHLTHHADPRIAFRDHGSDQTLAPAYFGLPRNTVIPETLRSRFSPEDAAYQEDFAPDIKRMETVNLHWTIRAPGWRGVGAPPAFKPFTKGFNAATAGANVIADRGEDDAAEYLGEDYPYLAADASGEAIAEVFARAERGVGGADWRRGLARMAEIRARIAPAKVMAELDGILRRFR